MYGHFRALFKHSASEVIIEAEIRKHKVFAVISTLHSNIVARVIIKAKELFGRLEKADL